MRAGSVMAGSHGPSSSGRRRIWAVPTRTAWRRGVEVIGGILVRSAAQDPVRRGDAARGSGVEPKVTSPNDSDVVLTREGECPDSRQFGQEGSPSWPFSL